MTDRIRIYGKVVNTWKNLVTMGGIEYEKTVQWEIEYREYYTDDYTIAGAGTEDVQPERREKELTRRWIYTWDGKKYNKGGHRWFEREGYIEYPKSQTKEVKEYLKHKYNAELVQLRG